MLLYLAAPLFNDAELAFNQFLAEQIEALNYDVFLPQREGAIFNKEPYISMTPGDRAKAIFTLDRNNLFDCDVFLYVLDGRIPDEGAAVALGIVHTQKSYDHKDKLLIGLQTDKRAAFINEKLNPMIYSPLDYIADSVDDLLTYLRNISKS